MDKVDKYLNEKKLMTPDGNWEPTKDTQPVFRGLIATLEDVEKMIQYDNLRMARKSYQWIKKRLKDIEQFL